MVRDFVADGSRQTLHGLLEPQSPKQPWCADVDADQAQAPVGRRKLQIVHAHDAMTVDVDELAIEHLAAEIQVGLHGRVGLDLIAVVGQADAVGIDLGDGRPRAAGTARRVAVGRPVPRRSG